MSEDDFKPQMDTDLLVALGSLVFTASTIETALVSLILSLIEADDPSRMLPLLGGMATGTKLNQICIMAAMQHKGDTKQLCVYCDDLREAFEERNLLVHSILAPTPDPRTIRLQSTKFKRKGGLPEPKTYTPESIFEVTQSLHSRFQIVEKELKQLIASKRE